MPVAMMERFLEILIERGTITEKDAEMVMQTHQVSKEPVDKVLMDLKLADHRQIMEARAAQSRVEFYDLSKHAIDREVARLIPENMARRHRLICVDKVEKKLIVAMANPVDIFAIDDLRLRTGYEIQPALGELEEIQKAWDSTYREVESWQKIVSEVKQKPLETGRPKESMLDPSMVGDEEAPIIRLVDLILRQAIENKASDIHIEAFESDMVVRYRVDGVLHEAMNPPKNLHPPVISRLKVMANLDLAEKRMPQDGRMQLTVGQTTIDFRVSIVPALFGEKVVMRLLDRSSALITLAQLGFDQDNMDRFTHQIHQPHGIILVTGPTGSGKSTTLYAALNGINSKSINIMTIEDPVEYFLKGINQIQAHPRIGLTFATGLRSFLRQDPDVIMVGEIRDTETAEVAIEAALTGHLVLSTLHTNDAVSAITRLTDMAIEPFLLSSCINAILAQRLVRKICDQCREEMPLDAEAIDMWQKFGHDTQTVKMYHGKGCPTCKGTGYKGRVGLYELLIVSEALKGMIVRKAPSNEMMNQARSEGLRILIEDGLAKVGAGVTTMEEVWRVTKEI